MCHRQVLPHQSCCDSAVLLHMQWCPCPAHVRQSCKAEVFINSNVAYMFTACCSNQVNVCSCLCSAAVSVRAAASMETPATAHQLPRAPAPTSACRGTRAAAVLLFQHQRSTPFATLTTHRLGLQSCRYVVLHRQVQFLQACVFGSLQQPSLAVHHHRVINRLALAWSCKPLPFSLYGSAASFVCSNSQTVVTTCKPPYNTSVCLCALVDTFRVASGGSFQAQGDCALHWQQ
jgi:hypothetical protein